MSTYDWYANLEVGAEVMTLNLSETERPVIHVTITKRKRDCVFEGNWVIQGRKANEDI